MNRRLRFRFWLIRRLAGRRTVMLNVILTPRQIVVSYHGSLINNNVFLGYPTAGLSQQRTDATVPFHELCEEIKS